MKANLLYLTLLTILSFSIQGAFAAPYNGYIVKVKTGSTFLSSKAVSHYGSVSKLTTTTFGTFARLETNKGLSDKALQALANNPEIEYIEPNYIISLENQSAPKDSLYKKQWGLLNTGKNSGIFSKGVPGEDLNISKAWEITQGATGNKTIKIAVIDTGVDYNHPDLKNQMDINAIELNGKFGVDDDHNGYVDDVYGYDFSNKDGDPVDGNGHGTHCAGVIGAAHNSLGVAGVMANVKIVAIKFLSDEGSGETIDAISAIDYAIKRKVQVMSNSWGGGDREQSLLDAIKAAEAAGITFVAAAGNESNNNDVKASYPANYDVSNVISVGSYTSTGVRSNFSNYGMKTVHVTAPGSNIISTYLNDKYSSLSGTSMATPHVAGVVGLLLSRNPKLAPFEIRERLIRTSTQTSKLKAASASGGRVDAYRALMNR